MPIVQNINNLIVPDGYVQIIPPQPVIQGVLTNIAGIVGTASYGPVNTPVVVGNPQQYIQKFGPVLNAKYDLGTAVYNCSLQGTQFFYCVRVTDGTDTSSTGDVLDNSNQVGVILTSIYSGTVANYIKASIGIGSSYTPGQPTYRITISIQYPDSSVISVPETFDNIGGSGATFWQNLVNAINMGQSSARGPSQIVIASLPTGIEAVNVTAAGSYTALPTASVTGPGSGAELQVHMKGLTSVVVSGGTGYQMGDTIVLNGGTHQTATVLMVDTVSTGAVATAHVVTVGDYTALPTNPVSQASSSGSGTGATFTMTWGVLSVIPTATGSNYTGASALVFSPTGATGTLQIGSIAAPDQDTFSFSGGTNGNVGVDSETLVGSDVAPRTGMYALRQTGAFVVMLADADEPEQWPFQSDFAISNSCYVIGTVAAGYQDNISGATALLQNSAINNYGFKLMQGDWIQFFDPFNNQTRPVSPQAYEVGQLTSIAPSQSSLNKPMNGIMGTQRTNEANPYSTADLSQLKIGRIDVITRPIPVNASSFGCRLGINTSSNALTNTDNYTLMANFIGRSISNSIGIYVGQPQTPQVRTDAKAAIQTFLMGLFTQGQIGDVNNPGNAASAFQVILDETNNPPDRVAAGYMQADVTVVLFSIIQFFVVNVNLVQGSSTISIPTPQPNI